jgi:hypothetical protein
MKNNKEIESCVFYFFNEDEIKIKKQKIHKIVKTDFFIQNELTNYQKLFKIKDRKRYFYICENSSKLKITEILEDDKKIGETYLKDDDTILLEFEGRELIYFKHYLKSLTNNTLTEGNNVLTEGNNVLTEGNNVLTEGSNSYALTKYSSKKYILTIINVYKHILNSIQLLVNNNIFHNHINFGSIVIDDLDSLLTNFSFSIDYSHKNIEQYIKHFIVAYEPSYIEWPIELHILSYLLTNKLNSLSSYNIENIINEVIKNNNILNTFGGSVVSLYKSEASNYFNKYVNQSYDFILNDILQYVNTWDNYALSILFLRILIGIHKTIGIKNKFIILFMKLLVSNIHLNPLKRFSVDMTIKKFSCLLDSLETKDYKDVINGLMSSTRSTSASSARSTSTSSTSSTSCSSASSTSTSSASSTFST